MSIKAAIKAEFLKRFGGMGYLRPTVKRNHAWYGDRYAGFYLCPDQLGPRSVLYSFGIGEDISFDEEVIRQFGCTVYGFDPTPKSIDWVKSREVPPGFHFIPVGISSRSGKVDFYLPKNPSFVSGSAYIHNDVEEKIEVPMQTLPEIMAQLGHTEIDVLKMDIEGAEYEVIDHILSSGIPVGQLLIEFHSRFFPDGETKTKNVVRQIRDHGYEIFAVSDLLQEVSFIRR